MRPHHGYSVIRRILNKGTGSLVIRLKKSLLAKLHEAESSGTYGYDGWIDLGIQIKPS